MKKNCLEQELKVFIEKVPPIKLTESHHMKINSKSWGILTDYYLESVKINRYNYSEIQSSAVLRVTDGIQQVTCVIRGKEIGLLFGLNEDEWAEIENLCSYNQQLFYRFFKDGLSKNHSCEQKLFYNFCLSNQKEDALVALVCRTTNFRNKDRNDAFLQILLLRKLNSYILDSYTNFLREY